MPIAIRSVVLVVVALLGPGAGGAPEAVGQSHAGMAFPVDTSTLSNGVHLVVSEDRSSPVVAVSVWHDLQGRERRDGRPGADVMARLLHRVRAEGSPHLPPGGMARLVERAGGVLDMGADPKRAALRMVLPAHRLELALWLHAASMVPLRIDAATLRLHRDLLAAQLRGRPTSGPPAAEAALDSLVRAATGRQRGSGGTSGVEQVDAEALGAFQTEWMGPGGATVVIVGDVDAARARELAERYLGAVRARGSSGGMQPRPGPGPVPTGAGGRPAPSPGAHRVEVPAGGATPSVHMAFPVPPAAHPDTPALTLLSAILDGASGRIAARLMAEGAASPGVRVRLEDGGEGGVLTLAVAASGVDGARLEDIVADELRDVEVRGVGSAELEGAMNRQRAAAAAQRLTVAGRAEVFQGARQHLGDAAAANHEVARLEAVSPEEVSEVARAYLDGARALVVVSR